MVIFQLLHESRIAICKFGEEVLSDLRDMYDFRASGSSPKKVFSVLFCDLFVNLSNSNFKRLEFS